MVESRQSDWLLASIALLVLLGLLALSLSRLAGAVLAIGPERAMDQWAEGSRQFDPAYWRSLSQISELALSLRPFDTERLLNHARYMERAPDAMETGFKDSLAFTERAILASPSWGMTWAQRALLQAKAGETGPALASLTRAEQLSRESGRVQYLLLDAWLRLYPNLTAEQKEHAEALLRDMRVWGRDRIVEIVLDAGRPDLAMRYFGPSSDHFLYLRRVLKRRGFWQQ